MQWLRQGGLGWAPLSPSPPDKTVMLTRPDHSRPKPRPRPSTIKAKAKAIP